MRGLTMIGLSHLSLLAFLMIACAAAFADGRDDAGGKAGNRNTDWFHDAKYGAFMHFLPGSDEQLALVEKFDVKALADQLQEMGAKYFVITLQQNSGYINSPNAAYDRWTGYKPGERCSRRDLPLELYKALHPKGIRLMLYVPGQVPNRDPRAQKAFGLADGPQDQPIDAEFARKWAEVLQEWSDRYGDKISGWWFDGCYQHVGFNDEIAAIYAKAVKHGNPKSLVAFNPGIELIRWSKSDDYTAGETNDPLDLIPASRWVDGAQWHALTFVGPTWGSRTTRFTSEQWAKWASAVAAHDGVITFDMGPNYDPQAGPIGSLAQAQVDQVKAVKAAVRGSEPHKNPKRLKRAESFLGIHFDFHAGDDCTEIGKNTTRAMIENIVDQVHPDYLQIDCKGHPGLSSYPTKVGNQAPGYVGDPLKLWREVTAERGISLYMHYSGVWDYAAVKKHPEWAAVRPDGKRSEQAISFFGDYPEKLLIPQLRELAGDYGVDGAWVDGECWASEADWGDACLAAFKKATGIQDVPRKPGDPHWREFLEFNRDAFRGYLRRYIAEVKKTNPAFQICSNWAFTDHMPEAVCAPVDWISGDLSPTDSVNAARFSARYCAHQGKPWDLMAWSFAPVPGESGFHQKSAVQLKREAAEIISLGGGFQAYFTQNRDGSVRLGELSTMAEAARFCRERESFCRGAQQVPQVALLYSTAAHYRESNGLFPRDLSRIRGTLQALLESGQSVEVVSEHGLKSHMSRYPLIVVPELDYLEPAFKSELADYARDGGSLLLVGVGTAALFPTELASATKATGANPDATIVSLGKGKIAATNAPFSQTYVNSSSKTDRDALNSLARALFPNPIVEAAANADFDVVVNRIHGHLAINLVNTVGPHADGRTPIISEIPPVGPIEMAVRVPSQPTRIVLEPGHEILPFEYRDGKARFTVPTLEIHRVVVIE